MARAEVNEMQPPSEGETYTVSRTFTEADVRAFAEVSGDDQPRHTEPDEDGRLLVHGLLTATLPTRIGGDLEVLSRRMEYEFVRPVYTGQAVTCTWTMDSVEEREDRWELEGDLVCEAEGDVVLRGFIEGLIWKAD